MKRGIKIYFFLVVILGLNITVSAQEAVTTGELMERQKISLTFNGPITSETSSPNPFSENTINYVDIDATLSINYNLNLTGNYATIKNLKTPFTLIKNKKANLL